MTDADYNRVGYRELCLLVLSGLPASGKSSLAQSLISSSNEDSESGTASGKSSLAQSLISSSNKDSAAESGTASGKSSLAQSLISSSNEDSESGTASGKSSLAQSLISSNNEESESGTASGKSSLAQSLISSHNEVSESGTASGKSSLAQSLISSNNEDSESGTATGKSSLAQSLISSNNEDSGSCKNHVLCGDSRTENNDGHAIKCSASDREFESHLEFKASSRSRFILVSYDELIPEDVELQLVHASSQNIQQGNSDWKAYRNDIISCVDSLVYCLANSETLKNKTDIDDGLWNRFKLSLEHQYDFDRLLMDRCPVTIVIDDNNYYRSMRYQYYQLARKYTVGFCQVHLICSEEVAVLRNRKRIKRRVPDDVIYTMASKIEIPNPDTCPWEILSLCLQNEENFYEIKPKILKLIYDAMCNPVQPIEEEDTEAKEVSRQICSTNQIHQADQILRKLVGKTMVKCKDKKYSNARIKSVSEKCREVRSDILQCMREGKMLIPTDIDSVDSSKSEDSDFYKFVTQLFITRLDQTGVT